MNIVVDIVLILFIVLGVLAGMKKGLIKTLVGVVGLVAIVILSYTFKIPVANFLIDHMPFFQFSGALEGLTSLNILIYNIIAFVVIFVVLYAILNILLTLTGFIDTLLKFTVIWIIPSKIGGAILGFFEAWIFLFLAVFILSQFNVTNNLLQSSKVADILLNHTPIVGTYLSGAKNAAIEIYDSIEKFRNDETKTTNDLNVYILQTEVAYGLIGKDKATDLIQIGKIELENEIMFGKEDNKWLNI